MLNSENLVEQTNGQLVTNSLLVAEKFNKRHDAVIRSVKRLLEDSPQNCGEYFVLSNYTDESGKSNPMYIMNRDGFSLLVMGFTGKDALNFKLEFIEAFNRMEQKLKSQQNAIPSSFSEALMLAARQAEQIELQQKELKQAAPKVEYFDEVLQSKNTYTSTQMAKELELRHAEQLHEKLKVKRVMFKQSGQWLLTADYTGQGYTKPRVTTFTHSNGTQGTNSITVWTEKGRQFLHSLFNNH